MLAQLLTRYSSKGLATSKAMANSVIKPNRAIHWILDWDGTLTQRDTLDALVNIAHKDKPDDDVPGKWNRLVQAYLSDYAKMEKGSNKDGPPTTVPKQQLFLHWMQSVEEDSIGRVSASGIFQGLTAEVVKAGAGAAVRSGEVQLRTGCEEFLQYLKTRAAHQADAGRVIDSVDILSVNWSQRFIAGCLEASIHGLKVETPELPSIILQGTPRYGRTRTEPRPTEDINVYANELQGIVYGRACTGEISTEDSRIVSSADKLRHLYMLRNIDPHTLKPMPIVYIGDSETDFECLLAADLGICIRDDPMTSSQRKLQETLERVRIRCPHISDRADVDEWGVVWARDFVEVQQSIQSW